MPTGGPLGVDAGGVDALGVGVSGVSGEIRVNGVGSGGSVLFAGALTATGLPSVLCEHPALVMDRARPMTAATARADFVTAAAYAAQALGATDRLDAAPTRTLPENPAPGS